MSSSPLTNLLRSFGPQETLKDPLEGDYDGVISSVSVQEFDSGALALAIVLTDLTDINGLPFDHTEKIFIPSSDSMSRFKFMFLDQLKSLGLIDMAYNQAITFDSLDENCQKFVDAVSTMLVGATVPLRLTRNKKTGFYNARFKQVHR